MNCSDIKAELILYADGVLDEPVSAVVSQHLLGCPVCRETLSEIHDLKAAMRRIRRIEPSPSFKAKLKTDVAAELENGRVNWLPLSAESRAWLKTAVLPYAAGVFASVAVGLTVLTAMFSGLRDRQNVEPLASGPGSVLLASNRDPFYDRDLISPADYARTRLDVSAESPSINPRGALVALTKSFVRGGMKDDEVVVVADVFGNGLAQIAEVVEPARDRQAMAELQRALASNDPQYAPFLTADLDRRSESMRVVLRFQNVDVPTNRRPRRSSTSGL